MTATEQVWALSRTPLDEGCVSLPISHLASGDRRLEASVYLSDGFTARLAIEHASFPVSLLGEIAQIWQPSRLKGITVSRSDGAPFLAPGQVFSIWPRATKWLAPEQTPHLDSRWGSDDCILVTCSGTVGNALKVYAPHGGHILTHDLMRVEIDEPALRDYVYLFLRTRAGRAMMRGSQYGTIIKHLEVEHLEDLPVPRLDHLVEDSHRHVSSVYAKRDEAYRLDRAAWDRLSVAMPVRPDVRSDGQFTVAASQLFGERRRLEATAHSPSAELVAETYTLNAAEVVPLSSLAEVRLKGRFKRIYGETGTPYLDSKPIFQVNPGIEKILTPATKIDFDSLMVRAGWLLMARSGTVGPTVLANPWHEDKVITEHILRIIPDTERIRAGYVQAVLSHEELGQPLVTSLAYGTSVPELHPGDVEELPIPRFAPAVENEIADMAERASQLRYEADEEENAAVAAIEAELDSASTS